MDVDPSPKKLYIGPAYRSYIIDNPKFKYLENTLRVANIQLLL